MFDLQPFTVNIIVYICVFLGVLLAYEGLQQLVFRRETQSEARNRRMKMIKRGATSEDVLKLLRDPALLGPTQKGEFYARLRRLLVQAGLSIAPVWIIICMGVSRRSPMWRGPGFCRRFRPLASAPHWRSPCPCWSCFK
ncbi:hypothetical protein ACSQ76_05995 [Roseovarius sp. B08]|uniref:hypothetical protein n=1 Tax=Roseovarius sp. B08 TaxID=3449223 RepID=UPI003EDC5C80